MRRGRDDRRASRAADADATRARRAGERARARRLGRRRGDARRDATRDATRRDGDGTTARTNVRGTRGDAFERAREDDDARDDGARREGW